MFLLPKNIFTVNLTYNIISWLLLLFFPKSFEHLLLDQLGVDRVDVAEYPDHHAYSSADVVELARRRDQIVREFF